MDKHKTIDEKPVNDETTDMDKLKPDIEHTEEVIIGRERHDLSYQNGYFRV